MQLLIIATLFLCVLTLFSDKANAMITTNSLSKSLRWRQALKHFVPVSPDKVNIQPVLEAIQLSPSSYGIQPYNLHVVTSQDVKLKLRAVSYDQPQVEFEASI